MNKNLFFSSFFSVLNFFYDSYIMTHNSKCDFKERIFSNYIKCSKYYYIFNPLYKITQLFTSITITYDDIYDKNISVKIFGKLFLKNGRIIYKYYNI